MALTFKTSQIANAAITASKLKLDGGDYHFTAGAELRWATDPSNANDLTRKSYVDNLVAGLKWRQSVRIATTGNITLSGLQAIDGVTTLANDRVLVKSQTAGKENGIYVAGAGTWSRSSDMDSAGDFPSAAMFVREGSVNQDTAWSCTNDTDPTLGTTAIVFAQFSGGGALTGGSGVTVSGNTISVNVDGSSMEVNGSDQLQIKALGVTAAMLAGSITNAKLSNSTVSFGGISVALGASDATPAFDLTDATNYPTTALTGTITATQLAGGIGNAKLTNSSISVTDGTTSSAVSLGGTITYTAGEGIDITQAGGEVTIVGEEASVTNKGVAKFNTADFAVTSGDVTIKALGVSSAQLAGSITNAKLVNSTISGAALGTNLQSLSKVANGGIALTSYNGSAAVTDLALDINGMTNEATLSSINDEIALYDKSATANKKTTISAVANAITGTNLTYDAASGTIKLNSNTISGKALGSNLDSLGAAVGGGVTMTSYNGTAAVTDIKLDVNGLGAPSAFALGTDTVAIAASGDANVSKKISLATIATAQAGTGISATSGVFSITAGAIGIAQLGLTPQLQTVTPNGSTAAWALTTDVGAAAYAHPAWVVAYVNGQRMKGVIGATPADDSEYSVTRVGTTTTVTFGGNLAASDVVQFQYLT